MSVPLTFKQSFTWGISDRVLVAPLCALGLALSLVFMLRPFRAADDAGFSWRGTFSRTQRVPWSAIVRVHRVLPVQGPQFSLRFELADGRTVAAPGHWSAVEALADRAKLALIREPFRGASDAAHDEDTFTFTFGSFDGQFDWCRHLIVALGSPLVALRLATDAVRLHHGHFDRACFLAVSAAVLLLPVRWLPGLWRQRRGWSPGCVVIRREGIEVRLNTARFVRWDEVSDVRPHHGVAPRGMSLDTVHGLLEISEGIDQPEYFRRVMTQRLPDAALRRMFRHAGDAERLAPTDVAPGQRRHHCQTRALRRWVAGAAAAALGCALFGMAATLWVPADRLAAGFSAPDLGAWLLILGAASGAARMRRFSIEVSADGCVWNGLLRRRRFAWSELQDLRVARGPSIELRLADGSTLRYVSFGIADEHLLLESLAERRLA